MSYKCLDCGHIFEEGEEKVYTECVGECHGSPAYDTFRECPKCGGAYEELSYCRICTEDFLEDDLNGGLICDECLKEYRHNFDACYCVGNQDKQSVEINGLLVSLLEVTDIEAILYDYIKKNMPNIDCLKYVEQDKDYFAETLMEEVIKNEHR